MSPYNYDDHSKDAKYNGKGHFYRVLLKVTKKPHEGA
jgi:hypothetical protein